MSEIEKQVQKLRYLPVSDIYLTNSMRISKRKFNREEFYAFDTETYKGTCKLICDSKDNYILDPSFIEAINFLWQYSSKNYYRCFWNIDFDFSSILKLWDNIEQIDNLIHGHSIEYKDFELYYIRPRMLQISKGNKTCYYVDLFNMYHSSLENASSKYLNAHKFDVIDAEKLNTDLEYWDNNLLEIVEYCKRDAELTANLGNFLMKKVKASKLEMPKFFTSHASLSKQYFRFNAKLPQLKYIPINILDIAFQCYYGGRFEILKRGFFKELYNYDINSAYPFVIRNLPSLKYGIWKMIKKISKNECIGYYKVLLNINKKRISPFCIRTGNLVIFPNGIYNVWITWYEADLLRDSITKLYYGYEYIPNKHEYYPFRNAIDYLYKFKTDYKDKDQVFYWLYKLTMNALYGCFIERHKKAENIITSGILFNSVYGSIITAKTRHKLLKDIDKKDYKHIVGFHTDSIISTKTLDLKCTDRIGDWSLDNKGSGVVLMSGIYQIGDIAKRRGFSGKKDFNWIKLLKSKQNSNELFIKTPYTKVMKIAECLKRFNSIERVNEFIETYRNLYINGDRKRNWERNFKSCKDVLENNIDSKPLEYVCLESKFDDLE